jgi:hypothetical protein
MNYWWDGVSTEQQDLTAQRDGLHALGVGDDRIYVDHGLTGANRDRPGFGWPWLRAEPVTRWLSPSWTGSPGRSPMPGTSDFGLPEPATSSVSHLMAAQMRGSSGAIGTRVRTRPTCGRRI